MARRRAGAAKPDSTPAKRPAKRPAPLSDRPNPPPPPTERELRDAQVWTLKEEGRSYREIRAETKLGFDTIARIFNANPDRLRSVIASQREERARLWQRHENQSLVQALNMQQSALEYFFNSDGKLKEAKRDEFMKTGPAWARIMRQSASEAALRLHALVHSTMELADSSVSDAEASMGEAGLIDEAIALGVVDMLPAALRERAKRKQEQDNAESSRVRPRPEVSHDGDGRRAGRPR